MSYEDQRRRYQQQRAERQVIDQAAAQLRHRAILAAYEGAERKEGVRLPRQQNVVIQRLWHREGGRIRRVSFG
jgi:hypothetical protein